MAKLFGKEYEKKDILKYVGTINQIAGARKIIFDEGKSKGVTAVEISTGSGFKFIVIPDRGMDIANADYNGKPVAWISKNKIVSPYYYEPEKNGFLRSFTGGLLTTCGLTQVGEYCVDGNVELGLHGRISHTQSERVNITENWVEDDYYIKLQGKVRESCIYEENIVLNREIICKMGDSKIIVNDVYENEGYKNTPFMFLYHINFGFPVVSADSVLYSSSQKIVPLDERSQKELNSYNSFSKPVMDYEYKGFSHVMPAEREKVYVSIVNEKMDFGVYVCYSPKEMPYMNQWKMMGEQDYVVGIEPGNTLPIGRVEAKKNNLLKQIKPGEKYKVSFEIGVFENRERIEALKNII